MLRPFGGLPSAATTTTTNTTNNSSNTNHIIHRRIEPVVNDVDSDFNGSASFLEESSSLGGGAGDTSDSKDSQNIKEELPREWFYDDMDLNEIDTLDEPKSPPDDEYDYDPRYGAKKRKKRGKATGGSKSRSPHASESSRKGRPPGGGVAGGRGRSRKSTRSSARKNEKPSSGLTEPPSFATAAAAVDKYFWTFEAGRRHILFNMYSIFICIMPGAWTTPHTFISNYFDTLWHIYYDKLDGGRESGVGLPFATESNFQIFLYP